MSEPQPQTRTRRPRKEPPRRTSPAGFILCVQCGRPLPAGLSRQARYCGPECKKTAHTQARRRSRTLDRLSGTGDSAGQIVLTREQSQQVRQAFAEVAGFLAQHRADYEAINSRPRSQLSEEANLYARLTERAGILVRAFGSAARSM